MAIVANLASRKRRDFESTETLPFLFRDPLNRTDFSAIFSGDSSAISSRAAKRGGFKRGGFPIWTCPSLPFLSFFVLSRFF